MRTEQRKRGQQKIPRGMVPEVGGKPGESDQKRRESLRNEDLANRAFGHPEFKEITELGN